MTDPSVIYGLELQGRWRGTIYASDLKRDTPYNTYMQRVCRLVRLRIPGVPSLRAAMEPAKTDYLYFVAAGAKSAGTIARSATTLEEHDRNVAEYRTQ